MLILNSWRFNKQQEKPTGSKSPKTSTTTTTTYARDPKVKAWVLKRANGVCECYGEDAPFKTSSGEPFLEVHHLIRLMDNGPDTVENCAGICPTITVACTTGKTETHHA